MSESILYRVVQLAGTAVLARMGIAVLLHGVDGRTDISLGLFLLGLALIPLLIGEIIMTELRNSDQEEHAMPGEIKLVK